MMNCTDKAVSVISDCATDYSDASSKVSLSGRYNGEHRSTRSSVNQKRRINDTNIRNNEYEIGSDMMGLITLTSCYTSKVCKPNRVKLTREEHDIIQQASSHNPNAIVDNIIFKEISAELGASVITSPDTQRITVVIHWNKGYMQNFGNNTVSVDLSSLSSGRDVAQQRSLPEGIKVRKDVVEGLCATNAFERLRKAVMKELLKKAGYDLFVTGHGYAATLSTLLGFLLARELPPFYNVTVVAFGSTQVGNKQWRMACKAQTNLAILRMHKGVEIRFSSLKHVGTKVNIEKTDQSSSVINWSLGTKSRNSYCRSFT